MEDWKQFFKNFIANNYFVTKIHNPGEVSSPIVRAIKDKEIPTVDPDEISSPIVDAIEKMQKSSEEKLESINESLNKPEDDKEEESKEVEVTLKGVSVVAIKGDKGDKPSNDELINLIKPLIPEPKKGDKGDDGKDYKLTATDKKEIAKSIKVPIVEKVIEKTEVIVEKPIITNEIKEVAVGDEPIVIKEKLESLEGDERLDAKSIKNLPVHSGGGITRIDDALDTDIDNPTNGQTLVYNSNTKQWENGTTSSGSGGHIIQDEGVPLTARGNLNFVGASVEVTDDAGNDATVVTITSGSGSGDVVGPASSVDNRIATFNGATGKLIKDSGELLSGLVHTTGDENIDGRKTILGDIWYFMQNFNIFGKTRTTDGAGYQLSITAGDGKGINNAGGIAQLKAGSGDSGLTSTDNAPGANVQLIGGEGFGTGNAGEAWLIGGAAAGTGLGGDVLVQGGHVQDNAIGARVLIKGGVNETGTSGDVEISTPDAIATNENAGNVILKPGAKNGSGNNGKVKVYQPGSSSILANLLVDNLTGEKDFQFPDQSGTIALLSDLASAGAYTVSTITSNDTRSETSGEKIILADATSGAITISLPTAVGNTAKFTFKKTDSSVNTVTVDPNGTETIDGDTTAIIQYQDTAFTIISDNANWQII